MKINYWSIIFTAIITALIGLLGYLLASTSELQKKDASRDAIEFTTKDATILRQELTDIMTDIDLRISLIERDIQWVKIIQSNQTHRPTDEPPIPSPPTPEELPEAAPQVVPDPQSLKYDLRRQSAD